MQGSAWRNKGFVLWDFQVKSWPQMSLTGNILVIVCIAADDNTMGKGKKKKSKR